MKVRSWIPDDRDACLDVFRSNIPKYFAASEEPAFAKFLQQPNCDYLVIEADGNVIACGGYYAKLENREARLCWGMVHSHHQGSGVGTRLLLWRLDRIAAMCQIERVRMDTSQFTRAFYERFGFVVESAKKDEYAPGLDRVDMSLVLDEKVRNLLKLQLQTLRKY